MGVVSSRETRMKVALELVLSSRFGRLKRSLSARIWFWRFSAIPVKASRERRTKITAKRMCSVGILSKFPQCMRGSVSRYRTSR